MQAKVLKHMVNWIDYDLFSTLALDDKAHAEKIGVISDNLHNYLFPLVKEDQYSLSINLYACADNPHLYHLTADVHLFPVKKITNLLEGGGFENPTGLVAIFTVQGPPPPPPPPPPREVLTSTNFITIGDQYNLVKTLFSIPTKFAKTFLKQAGAL
jgi:hypothetical protein